MPKYNDLKWELDEEENSITISRVEFPLDDMTLETIHNVFDGQFTHMEFGFFGQNELKVYLKDGFFNE